VFKIAVSDIKSKTVVVMKIKDNLNGFIDKRSEEIKQFKDKAMDKFEKQAGNLGNLKDKVAGKINLGAGELKEKAGKTLEKIKLENIIPDIRQIIYNKVAPKLKKEKLSELAVDQIFKEVFKTTYMFLPSPVRLIIDEESFVNFCLNNKSKLLAAGSSENECATSDSQDAQKELKGLVDAGILSQEEYDEKLKTT